MHSIERMKRKGQWPIGSKEPGITYHPELAPKIEVLNSWHPRPDLFGDNVAIGRAPADCKTNAAIDLPEKKFDPNCMNCAGPLNFKIDKCEYCGTWHRAPSKPVTPKYHYSDPKGWQQIHNSLDAAKQQQAPLKSSSLLTSVIQGLITPFFY